MLKKCDPGDRLIGEKGFVAKDICAAFQIFFNAPTKKNQLCEQTITNDQKISSKRIHIERIIGLGKTYTIFRGPSNRCETKLSDEIIFVSFILCSLRKPIVHRNAYIFLNLYLFIKVFINVLFAIFLMTV